MGRGHVSGLAAAGECGQQRKQQLPPVQGARAGASSAESSRAAPALGTIPCGSCLPGSRRELGAGEGQAALLFIPQRCRKARAEFAPLCP